MNTNVSLGSYPILVGAIIGIVELIKTYIPQVNGGVTIVLAALLGFVAGLYHIENIDPLTGTLVGLLSVGVDTQTKNIGNVLTALNTLGVKIPPTVETAVEQTVATDLENATEKAV